MDSDELFPGRRDAPLALLAAEDIERLSVDELDARVKALEAEIARTQARRAFAVHHKAAAAGLFKS